MAAQIAADLPLLDATRNEDIGQFVRQHLSDDGLTADPTVLAALVAAVSSARSLYGPLSALMDDETVSDIAVNRWDDVWGLTATGWTKSSVHFADNDDLLSFISSRLAYLTGRAIDESDPILDGRIENGPRICAMIPPTVEHPQVTIRKFSAQQLDLPTLSSGETPAMSRVMAATLMAAVRARLNIMVAGGAGAGKTTLLSALLRAVPASQRLVIIEDTLELQWWKAEDPTPNLARLLADDKRPGGRAVDLLRASLRLSPDRVVVGEVRGPEVLAMLGAMNIGLDGSMSSIHANNPADAVSRLVMLGLQADSNLDSDAIGQQIGAALQLLIQMSRNPVDGYRYISEISEVVWDGASRVTTLPLFAWAPEAGAPIAEGWKAINRPSFWADRLAPIWGPHWPDPWAAVTPAS